MNIHLLKHQDSFIIGQPNVHNMYLEYQIN